MENQSPADKLIQRIVDVELGIANKKAELREKYPDYEREQARLEQLESEVEEAKKDLTKYLAEHHDYDVHKVAGHAVSVTRVVKLEVEDIEAVPDDLKEMKTDWSVDLKEAQNRVKVLDQDIPGLKDKSYYRLNFKKAKNA